MTHKYGWGGEVQGGTAGLSSDIWYSYTNNRRNGFSYDASGNLTNDIGQAFTYDATGQQTASSYTNLQNFYDGDGLRVKRTEDGMAPTLYLRSSVLGGQVVAEIVWASVSWQWSRGYVYLGSQLLALQQNGVYWMHEDPVTKSKRVTNSAGTVVSTVELDPWGADTPRSSNGAFQPKKFTSYERDANGSDRAMFRRYNRWHSRFDQPDPYEGSSSLTDPQSFNRYAYTRNDPVNFVDPSGLDPEEYGPGDIIHIPAPGRRWSNDPTDGAMLAAVTGSGLRRPNPISEFEQRFRGGGGGIEQHMGRGAQPQKPTLQPDPCVTSPYVNLGLSGGVLLFGGSFSFLISNRGIYAQLGGGAMTPQNMRITKVGGTPFLRASSSGITPGWGKTLDLTYYARNYDSNGNLISQEGGFVGLPSASYQSTYTFRVLNPNHCK